MTSRDAYIALNMLPKIGPVRVRRLIDGFGSPQAVLKANIHQLSRVTGIGPETANIIANWENTIDLSAELHEATQRSIAIITLDDPSYPKALRNTYDPPLALYIWGEIHDRDDHSLGIVGSRRCSHYGTHAARQFAFQLATSGFTVISGLARGIDTHAHEGAIAANNGRTIAVIGSGLGQIYPPENMPLAEKIANGRGAIVSEFPLHTPPSKKTFPMRNRIVAAWSRAILVVECPAWSGALITANLAGELGKPIYAIPGQIDRPTSTGCNNLIREGATLVTKGQDIFDDLSMLPLRNQPPSIKTSSSEEINHDEKTISAMPEVSEIEQSVLTAISEGASLMDEILQATKRPLPEINACTIKLEMMGRIKQLPGGRFSIK